MAYRKNITEVYDLYHVRLWKLWIARKTARLAAAYPETGGVELYVHNWYVCGGTAEGRAPGASTQAETLINSEWNQWHRISARGKREYDRAEHATHSPRGFFPLWCNECTGIAGKIDHARIVAQREVAA